MEMDAYKRVIKMVQTTLEDFFEIATKPSWRSLLLDIIRKNQIDLWKIDVSLIAEKYLKEIEFLKVSNFEVPLNAVLICSILLKYKANRLVSFFELTKEIEEELKQEPAQENFEEINVAETKLDSFLESLKALAKPERKKYPKKVHYVEVKKPNKDFKTILWFVEEELKKLEKESKFTDFKGRFADMSPAEVFYSLLFIHKDEKVKIAQSELYSDFKIKRLA